jgi:hypothetical protein
LRDFQNLPKSQRKLFLKLFPPKTPTALLKTMPIPGGILHKRQNLFKPLKNILKIHPQNRTDKKHRYARILPKELQQPQLLHLKIHILPAVIPQLIDFIENQSYWPVKPLNQFHQHKEHTGVASLVRHIAYEKLNF